MLCADVDSNPPSPCNPAGFDAAILNEQSIACEVYLVFRECNPHRYRQIARTAAELVGQQVFRTFSQPTVQNLRPASTHHINPIDRIQSTNQDRCRRSFAFCDEIDETVNAVIEVDVGMAGWSVKRRVAARRAWRRVTRGIGFTDVGFGFDDDPAGSHSTPIVNENLSDDIPCHFQRRPIVERPRQLGGSHGLSQWCGSASCCIRMRSAPSKDRAQIASGVRALVLNELLGRAGRDDRAAGFSTFGP
jgi:hypothetical protein